MNKKEVPYITSCLFIIVDIVTNTVSAVFEWTDILSIEAEAAEKKHFQFWIQADNIFLF